MAGQLARLHEARRRRALYLGFAEDPVAFINAAVAAQANELRQSRPPPGAPPREAELERRTDLFGERWAEEAVARLLGKRNKVVGLM